MNNPTEKENRMTPKQLRSAAHALRTAANALEDVTTQLRTLSTEIDTPDPEPGPTPAWPTAELLWWDGELWTRDEAGNYSRVTDTGGGHLLRSRVTNSHRDAQTFAVEAVPVTLVPTWEWESWRKAAAPRECHRIEAELMNAADSLAGW